jgi:hypothetical protein
MRITLVAVSSATELILAWRPETLAGSTGLRRSKMFWLRWSDVDFQKMEVAVTRSCVRNRFGKVKTDASGRPVPLDFSVLLLEKGVAFTARIKTFSFRLHA